MNEERHDLEQVHCPTCGQVLEGLPELRWDLGDDGSSAGSYFSASFAFTIGVRRGSPSSREPEAREPEADG